MCSAASQYAVRHLATPLVVVMGHEECGAVTAAIESIDGKAGEPKYIDALVKLSNLASRNCLAI